MTDVTGTCPDRKTPRVVELHREGTVVSVWLHPPDAKESGWQAFIPLDQLRAALRAEGIAN